MRAAGNSSVGTGRGLALAGAALLLLAACDPVEVQRDMTERAAHSVILNVLGDHYARPAAERAASCVIANATGSELNALARDIGTRPGTSTLATIFGIGARPATLSCLAGQGLHNFVVAG